MNVFKDTKHHYGHAFLQYFIIGIIIAIGAYVGLKAGKVDVMAIMNQILEMLGGAEKVNEMSEQTKHQTFMAIFMNNWLACVQVILVALIPLPLYLLTFVVNSAMLGMVAYITDETGRGIVKSFVLGILPHGIIELPMIFLAIAVAMKVNNAMYKLIFSKGQNKQITTEIKKACLQVICIITPGLIVAALIESYITPILLSWGYR